MAVNQVIVNGEELVNLRNDTVTPQTLVEGETATNREGEHIQGELDPVSHDEAYLIDDPEGDIDDSDYIPFNDVSDEEQPKKKTLFSSIVDKLRTIFVSKSWGHVELLPTTETLGIKDKEVDATAPNNGVTVNHYPSSNDIRDNNNKIIARSEAIVYPNGTITAKMYAQNYDTNGNSVGQNAINLNVDKLGAFSYNVSDPNAFRSAIKTVDQLGTDIPENADLNTYKTAGTYRVPSDGIGATISNLPLALCGKVVVFNNGNGGFEQFYFPNHSPRIFVRTWWSDAWSAWKELGDGGDSKTHTYERGTPIPENSDLDTYLTQGVYFVGSDVASQTISNVPVQSAGKLIVVESINSSNYRIQMYQTLTGRMWVRYYSLNESGWHNWKELASTDDTYLIKNGRYNSLISENDDLNTYTTGGTYDCIHATTAVTLTNCPVSVAFKLMVDVENNPNILTQTITIINEKNTLPWRRGRDSSGSWGTWKQLASTDDLKPHTYEVGTSIPASSDLNTYIVDGVYKISPDATAQTIVNIPSHGNTITGGKLVVSKGYSANENYIIQTYYSNDNYIFVRRSADSGTTWFAWKQLASTDDISPSTVGNGYAVATVSGSAITATISGFQLRAGVIVALKISHFIGTACTLNINNTGAKQVLALNNSQISEGYPIVGGYVLYTFMYDGTNYRILSWDATPSVQTQSYVADTSGSILINWGYDVNRAQLKYNLSNNRLVWNYYKNSAWRGDLKIADYDDLTLIHDTLGAKNLFSWDLYTDIFINNNPSGTSYASHTISNGIITVTFTTSSGESHKGIYVSQIRINQMLSDFNGLSITMSCDVKVNTAVTNFRFGTDTSSGYFSVGTDYTHIEHKMTLDTSKTTNNLIFYIPTTSANTFYVKNIMVRPALISSQKYVPYSLTNQQIINGLGASVAKVGKNILPSWGYNSNIYSANGLTFTFNPSTGEITVNGTATADTFCKLAGESYSQYSIPKGTYIFTGCPSGGSDTKYKLYLQVVKKGASSLTNYNDFGNGCDVNLDVDSYSGLTSMWGIIVRSGQTLSNLVFKPMLRPAFTTAEYEPCEDIHKGNCYVGTCTTAGGTKDKVAYVDGYFVLRKGVRVAIKFSNTNTYSNVTTSPITLNVNDTGAKNIWYNSTHSGAGNTGTGSYIYGEAGKYFYFVYDGTYWIWDGRTTDSNSTNFLRNDASSTMTTSTPVLTLKASNIDLTQANNGVTSTQYPAYTIVDKNGKTMARFEAITETNGNISSFLYAGNIKTSDGTHFNGGIKLIAKKDGSFTWNITGDKASFHNNIGIGYCACSTAEATLAKTANLKDYALCHGSIVIVHFANNVPANSTLNINGQGAKSIYYRGNAIQANMILGGDRAIFAYDNYYHLIGIDRQPNYNDYISKSYNNIATIKNAGVQTLEEITLGAGVWMITWREQSESANVVAIGFGFSSTKKTAGSNFGISDGYYSIFPRTGNIQSFTCSLPVRITTATKFYAQHWVGGSTALTSAYGKLECVRIG